MFPTSISTDYSLLIDKNNSSILYYTIRFNFAIKNFKTSVEKHVKWE